MKYADSIFKNGINLAVIGATGLVGRTALQILHEKNFPIKNIYAIASKNSAGSEVFFGNHKLLVQELSNFNFSNANIALSCVNADISKIFTPKAAIAGCIVIDNSSYFRMDEDVPLIVPEINFSEIKNAKKKIIANPNCVAIPLAVTLAPLHKKFKIRRVVVATYQSVSGAGKAGVSELHDQTKSIFEQKNLITKKLPKKIAFNLIPQIDQFEESGFTKEESKIRNEIKKIIDPAIEIVATCVRVPVFSSHSISVNIEFEKAVSTKNIIDTLQEASGIIISDKINRHNYITPADTAIKDFVYVSRIRKDPSTSNGICAWIVADNIRKGAALNAVQIAEQFLSSIPKEAQHKKEQVDEVHI